MTVGKYLVVAAVWCSLVVPAVFAQGGRPSGHGGGKPPSVDRMIEQMQKELDLTDEQAVKIKAIFQEQQEQMEAQMQSGSSRPDRAQMEALRTQTDNKLAQILTSEQIAKWKNSRPQGGPPDGGNKPPQADDDEDQ